MLLRKNAFPDSSERSDDEDDSGTVVIDHVHHRSFPLYDSYTIPLRRNGSPAQVRAFKRGKTMNTLNLSAHYVELNLLIYCCHSMVGLLDMFVLYMVLVRLCSDFSHSSQYIVSKACVKVM